MLIHQVLLKKIDLASLKLNIDTLDINELEKVLDDLNSFKSKDVDKLKPGPLHLKALSDAVDKNILKKMCKMNWLKKLMSLMVVGLY